MCGKHVECRMAKTVWYKRFMRIWFGGPMCNGSCLINAFTNIHMLTIRHTLFINRWFRTKNRSTPQKEANTTTCKHLAIFMVLSAKNIQLQSVCHIYLYVGIGEVYSFALWSKHTTYFWCEINFKMPGSLYVLLYQIFFFEITPEVFDRDSTFAIEWWSMVALWKRWR